MSLDHTIKIPDNYEAFKSLYKRLFYQWMVSNRTVSLTKPNEVAALLHEMQDRYPYWTDMADDKIVDDLRLNNDMNAFNIKDVT